MLRRKELKAKGKVAFKRNYWACVFAALLLGYATTNSLIEVETQTNYINDVAYTTDYLKIFNIPFANPSIDFIILAFLVALLIGVFVLNVLEVGGSSFFSKNCYDVADFKETFMGFNKNHYKNIVYVQFIKNLKILFGFICLIIPGIIKAYEYYMVPYILGENPLMDQKDALRLSKSMMDGYKWDVFVFELSFLLWSLLSLLTFGFLNLLYVAPYKQASTAEIYHELKQNIYIANTSESSQ